MRFSREHIERIKKKALQSQCKMRVAALGFNKRGECVASSTNSTRHSKKGGGIHAKEKLFAVALQKGIVKIIICRINRSGNFLPIDPCDRCATKAKELGIKIESVPENTNL